MTDQGPGTDQGRGTRDQGLLVVASPSFAEHQTPPGHPESPQRAKVMLDVAEAWRHGGGEVDAPLLATAEQLIRVHEASYVESLQRLAGRSVALDADTFTSPETVETALLAAGGATLAVDRVLAGSARTALVMARPPGHHAERDRAMGFCFVNNVAVAAAQARAAGLKRVAIVDYDVHHGNGTQHIFERDDSILYVSMHQYPYYPGTGAASEVGVGGGAGFTVNVPLESGATDDDYREVFEEVVTPVLDQFAPELLLVSAGFDAHEEDPLGNMRVTTAAFAAMTHTLKTAADRCCQGRLVAIVEGGYNLAALGDSLRVAIDVLAGTSPAPVWPAATIRSSRGADGVAAARRALTGFWKLTG
jgi:acetoin utilization deacetylase AcuC-like enzyme